MSNPAPLIPPVMPDVAIDLYHGVKLSVDFSVAKAAIAAVILKATQAAVSSIRLFAPPLDFEADEASQASVTHAASAISAVRPSPDGSSALYQSIHGERAQSHSLPVFALARRIWFQPSLSAGLVRTATVAVHRRADRQRPTAGPRHRTM